MSITTVKTKTSTEIILLVEADSRQLSSSLAIYSNLNNTNNINSPTGSQRNNNYIVNNVYNDKTALAVRLHTYDSPPSLPTDTGYIQTISPIKIVQISTDQTKSDIHARNAIHNDENIMIINESYNSRLVLHNEYNNSIKNVQISKSEKQLNYENHNSKHNYIFNGIRYIQYFLDNHKSNSLDDYKIIFKRDEAALISAQIKSLVQTYRSLVSKLNARSSEIEEIVKSLDKKRESYNVDVYKNELLNIANFKNKISVVYEIALIRRNKRLIEIKAIIRKLRKSNSRYHWYNLVESHGDISSSINHH